MNTSNNAILILSIIVYMIGWNLADHEDQVTYILGYFGMMVATTGLLAVYDDLVRLI